MSRCETRVGSFEAPDGWMLLGEVGVVEGAPPAADAPPVFRRSIVLSDLLRSAEAEATQSVIT